MFGKDSDPGLSALGFKGTAHFCLHTSIVFLLWGAVPQCPLGLCQNVLNFCKHVCNDLIYKQGHILRYYGDTDLSAWIWKKTLQTVAGQERKPEQKQVSPLSSAVVAMLSLEEVPVWVKSPFSGQMTCTL